MIYPNILEINLDEQTSEIYEDDALFEKYLGGIGIAMELMKKHLKPGVDPLFPENVVIFAIGPLNTYFPVASKTCAVFKSPLTGNLGESYAGGRLSTAMKFNNLGAIILKGRAPNPIYFVSCENEVKFYNARPLMYMYPNTTGRIIREKIDHPGNRSVVTIGPAGEHLVPYACATVDRTRHFGRLGLGAVLGSKNVKGMAIIGDQPISLETNTNYREYRRVFREIYKKATETNLMAKYHILGTAAGILPLNALKSLPTKNFAESTFKNAEHISGEYFAAELLGKRVACGGCPIGCIHLAILRERWEKGTVADIHSIAVPYDYELIYALGSNLQIGKASDVLKLIEAVEREGMDAISTGVVLGWLAEAYERNVISPKDTKGALIRFGHVEDFLNIIPKISKANEEDELYYVASKGVEALVEKYGGNDFGIRVAKVEPAGYSTGPYAIMGFLIGGRHSHLDNAGYSLDQKVLNKPITYEKGIKSLMDEEEWRDILNSMVICLFARKVYDIDTTIKALTTLKINRTAEELLQLGKEIQKRRLQFKQQEGFSLKEAYSRFPKRFTEMMTAHGHIKKEDFDALVKIYTEEAKERYGLNVV
ncbi:MAG: aldehyde ferredoxin oxidoreductase N-terminal domain-containing protein [Candidatus Heimdallarchaeaceae archaeon]